MAANLASNAASSILDSILLGSDFPNFLSAIVHFLSLFFFEMSIAKNLTSFLASLLGGLVQYWSWCLILNQTEISTEMKGETTESAKTDFADYSVIVISQVCH
jgi:hypothetical protein